MENLRVGVIGLGVRGTLIIKSVITDMPQVQITAVCDEYIDHAKPVADFIETKNGSRPAIETDYLNLIQRQDVDAVVIASAWENHVPAALASMKAGKPVAMEIGGAYSIKQCWDLVACYEETRTPFMFMENCCYGRREMMISNMAEQGLLGEVIHCRGGYMHDLRPRIAGGSGDIQRNYQLRNYLYRNAESYPTHGLGPIAKILHINRGNRMMTLTSTGSKASGIHEYVKDHTPENQELMSYQFAQSDVVTTMIQCAGGETILLTLNTTLPHYYSRDFTIYGTKGTYEESTDSIFLEDVNTPSDEFGWNEKWGNAKDYEEKYDHPAWKKFLSDPSLQDHDGMDWLEFEAFFDCARNNKPCPIDVYDAAAWMSITALSEESLSMGGKTVAIPDFTNGAWPTRR